MKKKYEFTGKTKEHYGITLKQIRRISDGLVGGWIEKEDNLSHRGDCWVSYNAKVFGNALVSERAHVYGNAWVYGNALVFGDARVSEKAHVSERARVYGSAKVSGNAHIYGNALVSERALVYGDANVFRDAWVYGNAKVCGEDKVTGAITNLLNLCEFLITASITDKYIRVGCQSKSFEDWRTYVKSKSTEYLKDCRDEESHKKCVRLLKTILKNENAWKG